MTEVRKANTIEAIVIGASAGGVEAVSSILWTLPAGFAIPVVVVLHVPPDRPSLLAAVFGAHCPIAVHEAHEKEPLRPGTVYVAPPAYHLMIDRTRAFALSIEPPVNFSRPSIDVLFESAAVAYGAALAGVLLTGANDDGARGLARIGGAGGLTVVQDPATASSPTMPAAALRIAPPTYVLPLDRLGAFLAGLDAAAAAATELS